ncbi:MAG: 5-(carboxyamino)imidazole ribonucleotide mutase [Candidatus Nitrotoga sp.]|jgi:5-(carboxyamino)imidazole ribonucleotide mutase|nr:5-(carboxyamino)imidazole ribonucleotide mutase [Candidatus Nitrotoga sp.]MBP0116963.1 5-(carboxyamino)imidazole ribonucleotide mutase [Candidatus Nitrotoga sp.]MDW7535308.1 5-(carboxyamino)imidazole ribonucleotide mutase [Candidatus Nitrotoga sp.]MDW7604030.1 5-(carboxyamino)imidazole ribonucleotide mutase [Candidatus Nitrotoga sp.]MDW7613058.1 5-(carboxyamino)imidazole ribonucleotide mutase [Candidatus Nitrotoga sp.]
MSKPLVAIIMGSSSDWDVMQQAAHALRDFGVAYDARVISAHRSPELLLTYVRDMIAQGAQCFIAGAGGAAHLAGVIAGQTTLPVLGVPIPSKYLKGIDSLLSIVQMPKGIPVATFAIGEAGASNAALFAIAMLAINDSALAERLTAFRKKQAEIIAAIKLPPLN